MSVLFADRRDAGRRLATRLERLKGRSDVIVLGLPRGGVPVAYEVALALSAPLDVFVVRKLGVPGHEELAMGAVASGGVRVINDGVVRSLGISRKTFDAVTEEEEREVVRRERGFRMGRPLPTLRNATVVLVDDGVATGSTVIAAVHALREFHPASIVVAAPVVSGESARMIRRAADDCECVTVPEPFYGVGMHYEDFSQTSDGEVRQLLADAAARTDLDGAPHAARA
ncbi:MAG: phosphoribosyltransferase [Gemmatimonadales bacterium]